MHVHARKVMQRGGGARGGKQGGEQKGNAHGGEQEGITYRGGVIYMEGSYRGIMNIEGRKRGNIDGRCTWREARELIYMEGSKREYLHGGEQEG